MSPADLEWVEGEQDADAEEDEFDPQDEKEQARAGGVAMAGLDPAGDRVGEEVRVRDVQAWPGVPWLVHLVNHFEK